MNSVLAVLMSACVLLPGALTSATEGEDRGKPNVIVFYMDDVSPHDGSLWSDPSRTPTLSRYFVQEGVHFPNAIGENPLCCPARGNLLTGLHTHNNRVYRNNARLFDPSMHVGSAMEGAGYSSMFIGKYMNRASALTDSEWTRHGAGWTHLDVIDGVNGAYNKYALHTKTGDIKHEGYHSTMMVAERASERISQTAAETPVFAVLSFYNLHAPNLPMPEFAEDARCLGIPPWNPPNFNEADMSDKPASMRKLPLLADTDGWPMEGYCREMLGIDWAAEQVITTLEQTGRLDNTMLVFTADNGMGWGAHRWGQKKNRPYTTPVPLYVWWPARWEPGTIDEAVSSIDMAPTFCEIGGCQMGPFPGGQTGPDGVSMVPLLDGAVATLGRDAIMEAMYLDYPFSLDPWTGLRTVPSNPLGHWHYVEHATGERELYDLEADPYELDNVASDPERSSVVDALARRLQQFRREGRTAGQGRITITLDTQPNDGADFSYMGDLGRFKLDDDGNATLRRRRTFYGLGPGVYLVAQLPVPGWRIANISAPRLLQESEPQAATAASARNAGGRSSGQRCVAALKCCAVPTRDVQDGNAVVMEDRSG